MAKRLLKFPAGFLWGSATSAYQVEGGIENSDWSKAYPAGKACDQYNRYEEDFDIAKQLGQNAYRLSLEWSRIEPTEGQFNEKEIDHYRKVLGALQKRGIKPFVTLHHFSNPVWFAEKGGWANSKSPEYFERFVAYVMDELGQEARYWITINEPFIYTGNAYIAGAFPPKKKNALVGLQVAGNLARAHKRAYAAIKRKRPDAQVGIAKNNNFFEAYKNQFASRIVAAIAKNIWNFWFLNQIKGYQDFIGLNYYFHNRIHVRFSNPKNWFFQNEDKTVSDIGWEIYPEGLYHIVKEVKRFQKPIYILENGIADADDNQRSDFLREHLMWLHKAMKEGADVKGYFHWSLLDNFEWAEGFTKRFGLVHVDFQTLRRTTRPSAKVYAEICKTNQIEV